MANEVVRDVIEAEEAEEVEEDQYLVFAAQSREFGFQALRVKEITSVLDITEVPNTPSHIEGIMNLRGRLASVVNFRKKFRFEPKEHDEDTRVIIVEKGNFPIGVIVDSVEEVIRIPNEKVQRLGELTGTSAADESITGVGMLDERLIILLDLDRVLAGAESIEAVAIARAIDEAQTIKTSEKAESNETETVPASR